MRQLLINELSNDEAAKAKEFLAANSRVAGVEGLYWLDIPPRLLGAAQEGHGACGPFAFAVEVGDDFVSFELLIRSESNLHCSCTCYATPDQRGFLLSFMDRLVGEQGIRA
ncbi:MAG: hypothetical protein KKD63_02370 [Proteobacteria bacterium]|nr:hypothetical protein [Desulfobulbaceae bacterium]MBU4151706.1 hypothetical protein [Pseudomonadota bacterium]MDP2106323.1 hypothetical protein [Desulfobulbaceae bacterium]